MLKRQGMQHFTVLKLERLQTFQNGLDLCDKTDVVADHGRDIVVGMAKSVDFMPGQQYLLFPTIQLLHFRSYTLLGLGWVDSWGVLKRWGVGFYPRVPPSSQVVGTLLATPFQDGA